MNDDSLGATVRQYRTSRIQPFILFALALVLAALTVWFAVSLGGNIGTPFAIVCVPAAIVLVVWGYRLAVCVVEICERGVRLRYPIRVVEIPFSQIESVGLRRRLVRGIPGSANGIWLKRVDGSTVVFPIESNVEQACGEVAKRIGTRHWPQTDDE